MVEVSCPSCQKEYKVKPEAAGKKFRCKSCQTVVTVPQPDAGEVDLLSVDPWEAVDEDAPPPPPPPRRTRSTSGGKSARQSSNGGMPIAIMVSIGICGLLLALNLFGLAANLFFEDGSRSQGGGSLIRLVINFTIIKGLLDRNNRIRRNAIMLDVIGLVFGPIILIAAVFGNQQGAANDPGQKSLLIAIIGLSIVLWIVDLVALLQRSARDYCNQ